MAASLLPAPASVYLPAPMSTKTSATDAGTAGGDLETARARLADTGRNDVCPCQSGKKYKKCHLLADEAAATPPTVAPDPLERVANGWRLFEQRRPGAAEKEFRAALALNPELSEAQVGVGLAKLSAGDAPAAREALSVVVNKGEALLSDLRSQGVKDAFQRREAQPILRASHALGLSGLRRRPLRRRPGRSGAGLRHRFRPGRHRGPADRGQDLDQTWETRRRRAGAARGGQGQRSGPGVHEPGAGALSGRRQGRGRGFAGAGAGDQRRTWARPCSVRSASRSTTPWPPRPGSREEAAVYAQTYGDAWDDKAKEFLGEALAAIGAKAAGRSDQAPDQASAG